MYKITRRDIKKLVPYNFIKKYGGFEFRAKYSGVSVFTSKVKAEILHQNGKYNFLQSEFLLLKCRWESVLLNNISNAKRMFYCIELPQD